MKKEELLDLSIGSCEFKLKSLVKKTDKYQFSGYASIFNVVDHQGDIIAPGAFKKTIAEGSRVKLLWQHDPSEPIGIVTELREDQKGLFIKGELITAITRGNDAYQLLKFGIIDSFSIGYIPINYKYNFNEKAKMVRSITDLQLLEISFVTFPANNFAMIDAFDGKRPAHKDACKYDELDNLENHFEWENEYKKIDIESDYTLNSLKNAIKQPLNDKVQAQEAVERLKEAIRSKKKSNNE